MSRWGDKEGGGMEGKRRVEREKGGRKRERRDVGEERGRGEDERGGGRGLEDTQLVPIEAR